MREIERKSLFLLSNCPSGLIRHPIYFRVYDIFIIFSFRYINPQRRIIHRVSLMRSAFRVRAKYDGRNYIFLPLFSGTRDVTATGGGNLAASAILFMDADG